VEDTISTFGALRLLGMLKVPQHVGRG
jgi:hypothetical protein